MKAKDILEKTIPDSDQNTPSSQEDKVQEAYENISKKLESLRAGKSGQDDEEKKDETEEGDLAGEDVNSNIEANRETQDLQMKDASGDIGDEIPDTQRGYPKAYPAESGQNLDELAGEELSIPNLHTPKPTLNFNYRERQINHYEKRSNKRQIIILAVVGLTVVATTIFLLKSQTQNTDSTEKPQPSTLVATPLPTPTPVPTLTPGERSKYKINILNGTTKAGMAASVSAKLKELGYQTSKVGNATNSAFTKTLVRVKPSLQELADQLILDLVPEFSAEAVADLKDSYNGDAEIILGVN